MWVLIAVVSTTTTTTTTPAAVTDGNVYIDDPVIISEYFSHNALNIINYVMLFGALMGSGLSGNPPLHINILYCMLLMCLQVVNKRSLSSLYIYISSR